MMQFREALRNGWLDLYEAMIGESPVLKVWTGPQPIDVDAVDTGDILVTIQLPVDWMNDAAGGSKTKLSTWQELATDNSGEPGYFRIYDVFGVCWHQGSVSEDGFDGDLQIDHLPIVAGKSFTVTLFTLTAPGR